MKSLITGHRLFKLKNYNEEWIKDAIWETVANYVTYGMAGMASGVDLWFCQACITEKTPYAAYIPFDEQQAQVEEEGQGDLRKSLIESASSVYKARNSVMVEKCSMGIVVWDGNKGGTHNVVQQLVESKKPFIWINPVSEKIWKCF